MLSFETIGKTHNKKTIDHTKLHTKQQKQKDLIRAL